MGSYRNNSSDASTDTANDRLPEDLKDPDQRELDEVPGVSSPEKDGQAEESDDSETHSSGGVGGGGSAGVSASGPAVSEPTGVAEGDDSDEDDGLVSTLLGGILSTDDEKLSTEGTGIPPSKLEQWSKSGPSSSPKRTKDALSRALTNSSHLDRDDIEFRVFLQGSYKNHTNIHGNSDVDIVIQLTSPHRRDSNRLLRNTEGVNEDGQPTDYSYEQFKDDVIAALRERYGDDAVVVDDKAIKVHASDSTLQIDADVVVCQRYKSPDEEQELWFRSKSGEEITNAPEQHYQAGAAKNKATGGNYRKSVRMIKRARQNLVHKGRFSKDDAPSYFIAGLLSNVPDEAFVDDPQERFVRIVNYLHANRNDLSSFTTQHGKQPLFGRDSTRWNERDARRFVGELVWLYQNYYN
ncbi:nucleotidyltransferase [Halomarina rubra]|uniref:Nucleotidyltransferase n=1 Tax=Halomarina rubra TaxID=2071873 RepID=A0ABD6AUZ1_9EURY|nr:nucleotidyltransferase [Halomarina rubra]